MLVGRSFFKEIRNSVFQLFFPHICEGCGSDLLNEESTLCLRCLSKLPCTDFSIHTNNPLEKIFWGRLPLNAGTSQYYFTKASLMQRLMHQLKYRGNKELGLQLGRLMGLTLQQSTRFAGVDALLPLPLFEKRQKLRGYNQATIICEGIAEVLQLEILEDVVVRVQHTDSQTKKGRIERWQNIEGKFLLHDSSVIRNRHILLVDDVITTGATLEACGIELLKEANVSLSIATLCFAAH